MSDMEVQMEGVVPTYDKRRKGYKFKKDGMEIFIKGEDQDAAMKQMSELLESKKEEATETHSFAEGGMEDGGLKDEGGTVDPVSGNDVPPGSTQAEVRDDIPAQLSEGEFVFPADVVRYIGLENLMELRSKAKQGLAKMEAMGQMGNSDEATMDDSGEYDGEIDALIDNFNPDDPSTLEFNVGGAVLPNYLGTTPPQQQFSYGFMPPPQQGFQAPGYSVMPQQTQFITDPARVAVGQGPVAVENRTYVGPNGEEIIIPFYDGKPMQGYTIPGGYKYKKPEEAVAETPEVKAPVVQQPDGGDSDGDREREEAEQERMDKERAFNNDLAQYANQVGATGKAYTDALKADPFMTGKFELPTTAIGKSLETISTRTDMMEALGAKYGMNMKDYETGFFSFLPGNKYDRDKFMADLELRTYDEQAKQDDGLSKLARETSRTRSDDGYNYFDTDGITAGSKAAQKSFEAIARAAGRDDLIEQSYGSDNQNQRDGSQATSGGDASNVDSGRGGRGPVASGPQQSNDTGGADSFGGFGGVGGGSGDSNTDDQFTP